jgi:hypothetical protein
MNSLMGGVRQAALPLLIHGKSRTRKRARTDLCGSLSPCRTIVGTEIFGSLASRSSYFCNAGSTGPLAYQVL